MSDSKPKELLDNPTMYKGTYLEFLGFRLVQWKDGFARLEAPVRPEHRNTVGYLHGGVIASLLDIASAVAGSHGSSGEYVSITVNLNCTYMAPMQADSVVVEGELVRRTSSMFFAQSKLYDGGKKMLCATATGTYKPRQRSQLGSAESSS